MNVTYVAPAYYSDGFHCPHCNTFAHQEWWDTTFKDASNCYSAGIDNLSVSFCAKCRDYSLWLDDEKRMIYPQISLAPMPEADLPDDAKADFLEARNIVMASPRGAAALLRLALQKLLIHLGEEGKHIDTDIANLVKKGLRPEVQRSLDTVRIIGNESVHPGQMDLKADQTTAIALFRLINFIVLDRITSLKEIDDIYGSLPSSKIDAINKRDNKT